MAKAVTNAKKRTSTAGKVLNAVASLLPSKKATKKKAKANSTAKNADTAKYAKTLSALAKKKKMSAKAGNDPAHAPGHRKLNIKGLKKSRAKVEPQNASVTNNNAKSDRIHQTESPQRRLIPGASIERKGRRG